MKMNLFFTEIKNVVCNSIVDTKKVSRKIFDWDEIVGVRNLSSGEVENVQIKNISLFDHLLIINETEHWLLCAMSKNSF